MQGNNNTRPINPTANQLHQMELELEQMNRVIGFMFNLLQLDNDCKEGKEILQPEERRAVTINILNLLFPKQMVQEPEETKDKPDIVMVKK